MIRTVGARPPMSATSAARPGRQRATILVEPHRRCHHFRRYPLPAAARIDLPLPCVLQGHRFIFGHSLLPSKTQVALVLLVAPHVHTLAIFGVGEDVVFLPLVGARDELALGQGLQVSELLGGIGRHLTEAGIQAAPDGASRQR
jgi:hypothetical protein